MSAIGFGKHKGRSISDIPTNYLKWLIGNCDLDIKLKDEIKRVLFNREKGIGAVPAAIPYDSIKSIYRRLSKRYHPDCGGTDLAMAVLSDFYQEIGRSV